MTKKMESDETKIAVLVEKVGTMSVVLNKLDGKFDTLADKYALKTDVETVVRNVGTLSDKVSSLEGWKNKMLGALIVIQVLWGAFLYFLKGHA